MTKIYGECQRVISDCHISYIKSLQRLIEMQKEETDIKRLFDIEADIKCIVEQDNFLLKFRDFIQHNASNESDNEILTMLYVLQKTVESINSRII